MKKNKIFILLLLVGSTGWAQQLQTSSMYELQGSIHNPAMAGLTSAGFMGLSYRTQWKGINGNPKTATIFANKELAKQALGVGGYIYNDNTGPIKRTGLNLSVAKHIAMGNKGKLSFGIEAKVLQHSIDVGKLSQILGSDPVLAGGDNVFKFDAGAGVAYADDKFQIGASVSQLVQSKLDYYTGTLTPTQEGRLYRHYYLHSAYKWQVDDKAKIIPFVMFIYLPNAPLEFQGGFRVEHRELFWWGLSFRAKQSLALSAGLHINNNLSVGYSFDIYRAPLNIFDGGADAHEFMIRYNFNK
jgi:type IX secretion system PorP/SprF family membrane protein